MAGGKLKFEIVGVVNDSKYRSLRSPIGPTFYRCGVDPEEFVLSVRTRTPPEAIITPVRRILASLDPGVPFLEVHTMSEEVDNSIAGERMTAALASLFGGIAALLIGVGLYGLLAYTVMQRTREIGIRMALGAKRHDVTGMVLRDAVVMVAVGLAAGIPIALWARTFAASIIEGLPASGFLPVALASMGIVAVALVASYIPARRATKVDPIVALRYE